MRERRPLSCGLRRSNASRANRIWQTWRQRIASYRLRRSRTKLGKLARRKNAGGRSRLSHRKYQLIGDCTCMAESRLMTTRFYKTNPIFVNHDIPIARPSRPSSASIAQMRGAAQLNSRRVHRAAVFAGYRYGNGALYLVVCDDPMRRGQTGFGRLGAKGLLHTG